MNPTVLHTLPAATAGLPRTTPLSRTNGLRTLLLHLNAGEHIPEHQTPGAITVQCLRGEATFISGAEPFTLKPGALLAVAPAALHSVTAQQDTLLLVTIWEPLKNDEHASVG